MYMMYRQKTNIHKTPNPPPPFVGVIVQFNFFGFFGGGVGGGLGGGSGEKLEVGDILEDRKEEV